MDCHLIFVRAVFSGDAGADPFSGSGIHADGEGGLLLSVVAIPISGQLQAHRAARRSIARADQARASVA